MRQFVGSVRDDTTVRDLLVSVAPPRVRAAAQALDAAELAMMEVDDEPTQLRYAQALADWADAGGYEAETLWDVCTRRRSASPFERAQYRAGAHAVGRRAEAAGARGAAARARRGAAARRARQLPRRPGQALARGAAAGDAEDGAARLATTGSSSPAPPGIVTLEPGPAGATAWTHGGGFATYHQARAERNARLEELRRRWDEEHAKLKALVLMYKTKAAYNDGMASRYQAALTRLRRFEEAGPPAGDAAASRTSRCGCAEAGRASGPSSASSSS